MSRGERRDLTLICVGGGVTWFGNALAGLFLADSVPLAGLLVDRLPNRKLMIAANLGRASPRSGSR